MIHCANQCSNLNHSEILWFLKQPWSLCYLQKSGAWISPPPLLLRIHSSMISMKTKWGLNKDIVLILLLIQNFLWFVQKHSTQLLMLQLNVVHICTFRYTSSICVWGCWIHRIWIFITVKTNVRAQFIQHLHLFIK